MKKAEVSAVYRSNNQARVELLFGGFYLLINFRGELISRVALFFQKFAGTKGI